MPNSLSPLVIELQIAIVAINLELHLPKYKQSKVVSRTNQRRHVLYSGHVQGVGFRFTAEQIARGFKVTGYVKNLPDGRVELVAEGTLDQLEAFLQELAEQRAGFIRSVVCDSRPATDEFASFNIRY